MYNNLGQRNLLQSLIPTDNTPKSSTQSFLKQSIIRRLKHYNDQPKTTLSPTSTPSAFQYRKSLLSSDRLKRKQISEVPVIERLATEKTIDFSTLPYYRRVEYIQHQNQLFENSPMSKLSTAPSTQGMGRMKLHAKAINFNNFVKKYSMSDKLLMNDKIQLQKVGKQKIVSQFGPEQRCFIAKKPIKIYKVHTDRGRTEQVELTPQEKPKFKKTSLSPSDRERYSEQCQNITENVQEIKNNKFDDKAVFRKFNIENIEYMDLDKYKKNPLNLPLFSMIKDEEIQLKQRQVEEYAQYSTKEMLRKMKQQEKEDEELHNQYRRLCYMDYYDIPSISERYKTERVEQRRQDIFKRRETFNKTASQKIDPIKADRRKKILNLIKQYLFRLQELKLSLQEVMLENAFPKQPFFRERSKIFFELVKNNNREFAEIELRKNKFLVYDYDFFGLTALHHAVRMNHHKMVEYLLANRADVNAKDQLGRTPLFYAIKAGYSRCFRILLLYKASPWCSERNPYDKYLSYIDEKSRDQYRKAKNVTYIFKQTKKVSSINVNHAIFQKRCFLERKEILFYLVIYMLILLFSLAFAHEFSENVLQLNELQYDELPKDKPYFIMFYANWCRHCQKLMPTWNQLSEQMDGIGAVDCEEESRLKHRFGIKGFPSLIYIPANSEIGYKFNRERNLQEMIKFVDGLWKEEDVPQIKIRADINTFTIILDEISDPVILTAILLASVFCFILFLICWSEKGQGQKNKSSKSD